MFAAGAWANSDSWIGGGVDANWSSDANWFYNRTNATLTTGNGAPATGDNLVFAGTPTNGFTTLTNDLAANTLLPSILFDATAVAYTLNGATLALNGASNKSVQNNSAATQTIGMPLTLTGSRSIAAVGGPIVFKAAVGGTSAGVIFTGSFSTTLLAPANYIQPSSTSTSATQLQSGTLIVGTGGSLPTLAAGGTYRTNAVTLGSGTTSAVLALGDAGGAVAQTIDNLSVASGSNASADRVVGGATGVSTLTIDNTGTPSVGAAAGNTSFTGVLGGPGANDNNLALIVNMAASSNVTLQNTNTYTGKTAVNGGILAIGTGTVPGSIASTDVSVSSGATLTVAQLGSLSPATNLVTGGTVNVRNATTTLATLNGTGSIVLGTSTSTATLVVTGGGTYAGNIAEGGPGSGVVAAGGTLVLSGINSYTGATTVQHGGLILSGDGAQAAAIGAGRGGADVQGGRLTFDYTGGTSPQPTIVPMLQASHDNNGFNNTNQIRSTTADGSKGLGWTDDGASKFTVGFVYYGDSNLDGTVDLTDFTFLAANFNGSGKSWLQGDYNYDGNVDLSDFTFLASNFNRTSSAGDSLGTQVPEPTTLGFVIAPAVAVLKPRRRRSPPCRARG